MRLVAIALLAGGLWAAETPKPVTLTDTDKLAIRTLQLRLARVETAKVQIAAEEKAATEELSKIVKEHAARGCTLQEDLTCAAKPEKKETVK